MTSLKKKKLEQAMVDLMPSEYTVILKHKEVPQCYCYAESFRAGAVATHIGDRSYKFELYPEGWVLMAGRTPSTEQQYLVGKRFTCSTSTGKVYTIEQHEDADQVLVTWQSEVGHKQTSYTVTQAQDYLKAGEWVEVSSKLTEPAPTPKTAVDLLNEAAACIGDRAASRDTDAERSMKTTVEAFNAMYGTDLTEQQGWMFMVFLKASRAKGGEYREDDFVDGAAYFALAGECNVSPTK